MLTKKDKEEIRKIIKEEISMVFRRKALMEVSPRGPGDKPKHTKEIEINVLDELVKYLPYVEGALRGCQSDAASAKNRAIEMRDGLFQLVNIIDEARFIANGQKMIEG